MKILIVEDEEKLRDVIRQSLEKEQYVVESASDYRQAIDKIWSFEYDCILLDIMLPDGSGLKVLEELKRMDKADSVIIISAKDSLDDKVEGLELGADDYLTKPFHMAELTARLKSVLRRKTFDKKSILEVENVRIDPENKSVVVDEKPLHLNRKEFDTLIYFALNKNRLVTKTSLAEHVWGDYVDQSNDFEFIYWQIKNLRKKLKDSNAHISIQSVYGMGYKLEVK